MPRVPEEAKTREEEAIKSFEDLSDEQREKIENELIFRFLERNNRKLYRDIFKGKINKHSGVWLGSKIWKGDGDLPPEYKKEMTHFREVLARLRNAPFTIDAQGEVQFDLEAVLMGQQVSQSNIASDDEALHSLKNANWEMDFSGFFIKEDKDDQATIPLKPVS